MKYEVKISKEAFDDIQNAILYLNSQKLGLGKRFLSVTKRCIKVLQLNPLFEVKYANVRTLQTKPFAYLIHFVVDESQKTVIILSVLHSASNWLNNK